MVTRIIFISILAISWATATPASSVTITNTSSTAMTSRPVTVPRFFARGEFDGCVQASIDGTPVTTQNDIKTYWSDGSVQFSNLSFVLPSLAAGSAATITFAASSSCNNTGYLDKTALLDSGMAWAANLGAEIRTTNGSTTLSANLLTMLNAWDGTDTGVNGLSVRYWLKGPVVSQLIVEDRSTAFTYDFGWTYNGSAWVQDSTYASLHPIYVVTVWPGQATVKIEAILENAWTTKLQDQAYDLDIRLGNPLAGSPPATTWTGESSYLPKSAVQHYAKTRWHKVFWSGTAPGALKIDLNFEYMRASGAVPNYDPAHTPTLANVTTTYPANWTSLSSTARDIGGIGNLVAYMPATGQTASDHIGVLPTWDVLYLYAMGMSGTANEMLPITIGNADALAHWPVHFRESRDTGYYCAVSCTGGLAALSPQGRPISIDTRPTWRPLSQSGVQTADATPAVATLSVYNSTKAAGMTTTLMLQPQTAHQPDPVYAAYLITGDWYYLEELQFWAVWGPATLGVGDDLTGRNASAGTVQGDELRGEAWALRTLGNAAAMSVTGSPEKIFYENKLANNASCIEGFLNVTNGAYHNAYEWARCNNTSKVRRRSSNPLRILYNYSGFEGANYTVKYPTAITAAAPMVVTAAGHGLTTGQGVYIRQRYAGQDSGPWLGCQTVTVIDSSTFSLDGTDGTGYTYDGSGLAVVWKGNWLNACVGIDEQAPWQYGFYLATIDHIRQLGYPWTAVHQAAATLPMHAMYDADAPSDKRAWLGGYYWPTFAVYNTIADSSNRLTIDPPMQTMTELVAAAPSAAWAAQVTVDATYGFPGWDAGCGNASGYPHVARAAFATLANYTVDGFSGATAYSDTTALVEHQELLTTNPKWAYLPEAAPAALAVSTSSLAGGMQGTAYSAALAATGGTSPYTWTISSGALPTGLTLAGGTISGTPTTAGTSTFDVTVTDVVSGTDTKALSIQVTSTLAIITSSIPSGTTGVAYSTTLAASGGTAPYTWAVTGGSLPSGLTLSSAGAITGTPTVVGSYSVTITVTDAAAFHTESPFSILVSTAPVEASVSFGGRVILTNGVVK